MTKASDERWTDNPFPSRDRNKSVLLSSANGLKDKKARTEIVNLINDGKLSKARDALSAAKILETR